MLADLKKKVWALVHLFCCVNCQVLMVPFKCNLELRYVAYGELITEAGAPLCGQIKTSPKKWVNILYVIVIEP